MRISIPRLLLLKCTFLGWIVGMYLFQSISVSAQQVSPDDDFDVLVIPIGPSVQAPGKDITSAESLEARGLQIAPVSGFDLGSIELGPDRLSVHLKAGEAVQVLSVFADAVPVSTTSVYFSVIASASGEPLQQAALAILDGNNPNDQAVSISLNQDLPGDADVFSLEFNRQTDKVIVLIQAVGPLQGESFLTLERMRLLDGYRELDMSLGATVLTSTEHFGNGIGGLIVNQPPTTSGGAISVDTSENHLPFPDAADQSLRLSTQNTEDIVQVLIPLTVISGIMDNIDFPKRFYGLASIKRLSGDNGTFTLALASGTTASVGYGNYSISAMPSDSWLEVQSPIQLSKTGASQLFLIAQLNGGPAEIVIDDVAIHAQRDSMYLWDASVVPDLIPPK